MILNYIRIPGINLYTILYTRTYIQRIRFAFTSLLTHKKNCVKRITHTRANAFIYRVLLLLHRHLRTYVFENSITIFRCRILWIGNIIISYYFGSCSIQRNELRRNDNIIRFHPRYRLLINLIGVYCYVVPTIFFYIHSHISILSAYTVLSLILMLLHYCVFSTTFVL